MGLVTLGMLDKGWPDFRGPSHPYFKHLHAHESKTLFCAFRNRSRATCPRLASHLWWGREWLELLALLGLHVCTATADLSGAGGGTQRFENARQALFGQSYRPQALLPRDLVFHVSSSRCCETHSLEQFLEPQVQLAHCEEPLATGHRKLAV